MNSSVNARTKLVRAGLLALVAMVVTRGVLADPFPPAAQALNVKQIGFLGLDECCGGAPTLGGERRSYGKIAIKRTADDRWYLYTADMLERAMSIVEVTDPTKPRYVKFFEFGLDTRATSLQVTLHDNLLLTSLSSRTPEKDPFPAVLLWDISDPENPKQLGSWIGGNVGSHRNSYPGGKYAYLSTSYPGFEGNILVILDVSDPLHPREVGKWWQTGQKEGEPNLQLAEPDPSKPAWMLPRDFHGPLNVSPDGKSASLGYTPDVVNLDLSDPANPRLVGRLHITSPFASVGMQSVHTVLPYWDRKLLFVSSEAQKAHCADDGLQFAGMIDNADPKHPKLISVFPTPVPPANASYKNFCDKGGRFGPHNTSQEIHNPAIQQPGNLIYIAWFNAGLRVFDISDARLPREVGYFMPPERPDVPGTKSPTSDVNTSQELAVDSRGNIFMNDDKWGMFVLRYTGKSAVAP
jgi:hypothetical protein